jgi:glucokinase
MIDGWMRGAKDFLAEHSFSWDQIAGAGLAMPGPYLSYGVLGKMPNMPESLKGWPFLDDLTAAIAEAAGRSIPTVTANDGQLAGLAEASAVQAEHPGSVLMLAPGSGVGCAYVRADGSFDPGDNYAAAAISHLPAPVRLFDVPPLNCGCGYDWNCIEPYTSISGLAQLIRHFLPKYPDHALNQSKATDKEKALSLRGLAQTGDPLAQEIFDLQATGLGYTIAMGNRAFDPTHIIIGGGIIDPDATTADFRQRYFERMKAAAAKYVWTDFTKMHFHEARLGELSQAIGAALLARQMHPA